MSTDERTLSAYAARVADHLLVRDDDIVVAERLVAGGSALTRRADGRIVLVPGALPGERVEIALERRHGADRGRLLRIIEASPARVDPSCPQVAAGCGGCDLAMFSHPEQAPAKVAIVADALRRLGRIPDPVVRMGPRLEPWGFRTTLRVAVLDGRPGLRRADSHDVVVLDSCDIAHPSIGQLLAEGEFGDATDATIRVGARTGERMVVCSPSASGVRMPPDVMVVGSDELTAGRRAWIHDEVAGHRWRISAGSFFQTRPDGAEALVEVVRSSVADVLDDRHPTSGTLVDAYCGVGLFAGSLLSGRDGWRAVGVERNRSSVADARINLQGLDARVIAGPVERFKAPRAEIVVADPSRAGLGRAGVEALISAGAPRLVLVSCDPASAGRDVALLDAAGYSAIESVVVDLFPHTHHTEVVTRFDLR